MGSKNSVDKSNQSSPTQYDPKKYLDTNQLYKHDIEADLEPIATHLGLKLNAIDQRAHPLFKKNLDYLPLIRRFSDKSKSVSIYMIFGCILVENIIEHENEELYFQMTDAFKYLLLQKEITEEQRRIFNHVEGDFLLLISSIQKERQSFHHVLDSSVKKDKLYKYLYSIVNVRWLMILTLAAKAVFAAFAMKHPLMVPKEISDELKKETVFVHDVYIREFCQLFALMFSFKIDLFDINTETYGREKIHKTEIYPDPYTRDFIFHIAILNVIGKGGDFKAFGYPRTDLSKSENLFDNYQLPQVDLQAYIDVESPVITEQQKHIFSNGEQMQEKDSNHINGETIDPIMKLSNQEIPKPPENNTSNKEDLSKQEENPSKQEGNSQVEQDLELVTCSMCQVPIRRPDAYTNLDCNHNYCIYCMQEETVHDVRICLVRGCSRPTNCQEMKKFIHDHNDKQIEEIYSPSGKAIKISSPVKTAEEQKILEEPLLKACNLCKNLKYKSEMFENTCGHTFCPNCIQTGADHLTKCLQFACQKNLDSKRLMAFIEKLNKDHLLTMKIYCRECQEEIVFHYQKGAKPDYFKCTCKTITCLKHNDMMSKCLCLCDKCLSSFELNIKTMIKACRKCESSRFCALCGNQSVNGRGCDCVCKSCLSKKTDKEERLCKKCLSDQTDCAECHDLLDEMSEFLQICGHKICIPCQQQIVMQEDNKYRCAICNAMSWKVEENQH